MALSKCWIGASESPRRRSHEVTLGDVMARLSALESDHSFSALLMIVISANPGFSPLGVRL
jgi:hypothetical protein